MMSLARRVSVAVFTAAVTVPCLAASSPWDGTWKKNPAKTKLGDTFSVSRKPGGMYHFSDGSAIQYDFACDGKEYTIFADRTETCSGSDAAGFDFTYKANGKALGTEHQMLTDGGKVLMASGKSLRPDGSTSTYESKYVRVAGTGGMAGTWKSVADKSSSDSTMQIVVADGVMHWKSPEYKESFDAKLDGTPAAVSGPTLPPGAMTSVKAEGPMKVHYADMLSGKTLWEGTQAVSADGKTLTVEQWVPGKMAEKTTEVYEKQ